MVGGMLVSEVLKWRFLISPIKSLKNVIICLEFVMKTILIFNQVLKSKLYKYFCVFFYFCSICVHESFHSRLIRPYLFETMKKNTMKTNVHSCKQQKGYVTYCKIWVCPNVIFGRILLRLFIYISVHYIDNILK